MKILRWLKWQFYRMLGYGNCWLCKTYAPLSWFKETFEDKVAHREVEWSGWICSTCWHKRMDGWKGMMETFRQDFEKNFR